MSNQLKEKQQQTDNKREFDADHLFNQHLFRTLAYAGAGFGAGMVASLFIKQRKLMTLVGTGVGAAYGGQNFMNDLNHFRKFKDYNSQDKQPHTLKREDQTSTKDWESFMPKQESQSDQKRYGGSDNDDGDKKESKSNSQQKSSQNKSSEASSTNIKRDSSATTSSSHNKDDDKSSHEFGKSKGQSAKSSSHDRTNDKSSQQFGDNKSSDSKGSSHHQGTDKSSHQAENKKSDVSKSSDHSKQHEKSVQHFERSESSKHESESGSKGEGQQLQDFKSNTKEAGRPAPGDSELYRGSERPRHTNKDIEHQRGEQNRTEQDRWGESKTTGNKMKLEAPSDSKAGNQFNAGGLTAHSQVNTVLE